MTFVSRADQSIEISTTEVTLLAGPGGEGEVKPTSIIVTNPTEVSGRLMVNLKRATRPNERIANAILAPGGKWELPESTIIDHGDLISAFLTETPTKPWQAAVSFTWQDHGAPDLAALFVAANSEYLDLADEADWQAGDIDFSIYAIFKVTDEDADHHLLGKWKPTGDIREYRLFFKTSDKKLYFQITSTGAAASLVEVATAALTEGDWYHVHAYHSKDDNVIGIAINNGTATTAAAASGIYAGTAATGTITVVAGADLSDGDYFTIDDGINDPVLFEFDSNASVTGGRTGITFTGSETATEMRDLVIAAIEDSDLEMVPSATDTDEVTLTHNLRNAVGNETITENVTNAGFTVTGMAGGKSADFRVGLDGDDGDDLDGAVSSFGIWKRLLTAAELTWLYNSGLGRDVDDFGASGTDGADLLTSLTDRAFNLDEASGDRASLNATYTLSDNASVLSTTGVPK